MQTRIYQADSLTGEDLADKIRQWFADQGYETQTFRTPEGRILVQGYRDDLWRVAFGFAVALTVEVHPLPDRKLEVTLGAGAWGDKLIIAGVGLLLFLPLVLTAAWGTWQQYQLDQQMWTVIEGFLPNQTEVVSTELTPTDVPRTWFDPASGDIYSIKFFERMESWQRAMADGRIDGAEIQAQAERVTEMLRRLEPALSTPAHSKITETLSELAVLQGMQSYALYQHLDGNVPTGTTVYSISEE